MVTHQFIKQIKNSNIKIDIINYSGDKNIGREIVKNLEKYKKMTPIKFLILFHKFKKKREYCYKR